MLENLRKSVNNAETMDINAKRCYVFSKEDKVIWWRDILDHAEDAECKGWKVRTEVFEKGQHTALMRYDKERYWATVKNTWLEASI